MYDEKFAFFLASVFIIAIFLYSIMIYLTTSLVKFELWAVMLEGIAKNKANEFFDR